MKYIDLSYTIESGIKVHPFDETISLKRNKFLDKDKYNDSKLITGMHVGTHIDAPSHLLKSDKLISDYEIDKFVGNGILIDVRNQDVIKYNKVYENISHGDIVLFYTGYDKQFGSDNYFNNHPIIDEHLANFLIEKKIKMIGLDMPSPDKYPFIVHKMLLKNDILIIENLKDLHNLIDIDKFEIIAIPLKIKAEASLLRVVARY